MIIVLELVVEAVLAFVVTVQEVDPAVVLPSTVLASAALLAVL